MSIATLVISVAFAGAHAVGADEGAMAPSRALFMSDVRALLTEKCLSCHGERVRARFDLTTREGLLAGGESGVAVVAGSAAKSPMIGQLTHLREPFMPPDEPPLPADAIARIAAWIDLGAAYEGSLGRPAAPGAGAMQVSAADRGYWAFAPLRVAFPEGACIDDFVRKRREEKNLTAAPPASRQTLIRRLYFDVIGLPPEPPAVEEFLADPSRRAYEGLVDRLLASPQFGEKWARHWLDVARFAESHGFEHDYDRRYAFHYRDFVIKAFNQDMRYDQFVRWQLAGDELAPEDPLALSATGFLAAGVHPTQITISDAERLRYDEMDDMLATTGSAMLAVTIGCARCHDHKYDPVPTSDYYRMLSAFTTTVSSEVTLNAGPVLVSSEGAHVKPVRLHLNSDRIPDFYPETYFLTRGDPALKDGVANLGFLQVLTRASDTSRWTRGSHDPRTSGRRAALSRWITDVDGGAGPLLARVIVNRLWQHHFGRGIVATPNDFGTQGDRPTHPELLDWLATQLVGSGWRLKTVHKLILMSDAYRMGDLAAPGNETVDPDNRFLWRRRPRRLEAEAIRDSALAAGGLLDETMFGPGTLEEGMRRRSIYFTIKRSQLVPTMQAFDWPDGLTSLERRAVTTTAPQALVFLNAPEFRRLAEGFAARVEAERDRIGRAYLIAYGRPPSERERTLGEAFLRRQAQSRGGDVEKAFTDYCAALMSASEFIYVD